MKYMQEPILMRRRESRYSKEERDYLSHLLFGVSVFEATFPGQ